MKGYLRNHPFSRDENVHQADEWALRRDLFFKFRRGVKFASLYEEL